MGKTRKPNAPVGMLEGAIRDRIQGLNLTPYRVGKMTGVDASVIQRFMAGERSLTLGTAEKLAKALDLVLVTKPSSTLALDLVREREAKAESKYKGDE
jgi:plasmid maintenance system antidote protein VapI